MENEELNYALLKVDVDHLKSQFTELAKEQKELNKTVGEIKEEQRDMKRDIKDLVKVTTDNVEAMKKLSDKIDNLENKGKFDWLDAIKTRIIPTLLGGGIVYCIIEIVSK